MAEEFTKVLEAATTHFSSREIISIDVPEWETTVYSKPLTLGEKRKLYRNAESSDLAVFADVLIMKAEDEHGEKMFRIGDKNTLMNRVDPDVVTNVGSFILRSGAELDAAGN